jgi:hypothetical protein
MNEIVKAIKTLRPEAEFVIHGDDLENIDWHVIEGAIPTKKEILNAMALVEKKEAAEAIEAAQKKASLLERLGITEDEAKLLLS